MKLRLTLLLAVLIPTHQAVAKPSVVVTRFVDEMSTSPCNVHKLPNGELTVEMARKLIAIFANHADLRLANFEKNIKPQYSVTGTLRSFDSCHARKPNDIKTKVAIEMKVVDTRTGNLAFIYTSSANATGTSLDQTAHVVLYDLAYRIERALISRKSSTHLIYHRSTLPTPEYQVRLVRKDSR